MSGSVALEGLDLAALLCSRVCHDLISPVGAIMNGLEVMEEGKDEETSQFAMELIKKSARTASAKLQFCRIAFGAAGSAGAQIDTGDAEKVARGLIEDDRTKVAWNLPRVLLAKNRVKLLLNMMLLAAQAIPRGGQLTVDPIGAGRHHRLQGLGDRHQRQGAAGDPGAAGGRLGRASGRCPCDPAVLHQPAGQECRAQRRPWPPKAMPWWSPTQLERPQRRSQRQRQRRSRADGDGAARLTTPLTPR